MMLQIYILVICLQVLYLCLLQGLQKRSSISTLTRMFLKLFPFNLFYFWSFFLIFPLNFFLNYLIENVKSISFIFIVSRCFCSCQYLYRNVFFYLHQKIQSVVSAAKFRQNNNCYKKVFESAKLTKKLITKRRSWSPFGNSIFRPFANCNSVLSKIKPAILGTLILMTQVFLCLLSLQKVIWR